MNPSKAEASAQKEEGLTFRDKVDSLSQNQNLGTVPTAHFRKNRLNHINREAPPAPVAVAPAQSPAEAAPPAVASTESPSPSPTDAQVQGQEANNGELPNAEPFYPNPYAYHQQMLEMVRDEVARENAAKSGGPSAGAAASADNTVGQPAQLIKQGGGGSVLGGNPFGNGIPQNANVTSNLSQQDIQWLMSTSLKGVIPSLQVPVTAHKLDGSAVADAKIWSTRWDLENGVKTEGAFATRSSSGGYPLQFEVSFNLLDQNQIPVPIAISMKPSDSNAKNDVQNGHTVRIYHFSATDVSIRSGTSKAETVRGLVVHLVMDISTGTPTLVEGSFGFQRAGVKTDMSNWEAGRAIASANDQIVVDQLPFSMKLEKSQ